MFSAHSNINDFIKDIRDRLVSSIEIGLEVTGDHAKDELQALTSGSISSTALRQAGYPFARRHASKKRLRRPKAFSAYPLTPINFQTGNLQRSYFGHYTEQGPDTWTWEIGFSAPYAFFVLNPDGTKYMVPRKFWEAAEKAVKPLFQLNMVNSINIHFP